MDSDIPTRKRSSLAALFFVFILVGSFIFLSIQQHVNAIITEDESISLSGTFFGPVPTTLATIDTPKNNASLNSNILTVSGTCQGGFIVEIYRNNALAGTIICSTSGEYSLQITLVEGLNTLRARTKNGAGKYGPDSTLIKVNYVKSSPSTSGTEYQTGPPLLIFSEIVQLGINLSTKFTLEYEIDGGNPSYAVYIDWGDGSQPTIISHDKSGNFEQEHLYLFSGQFTITIRAIDTVGNEAIFQTIAIVNGEIQSEGLLRRIIDCTTQPFESNKIVPCILIERVNAIWPAFLIAILMALSFWLGEVVMRKRLQNTQI